MDRINIPQFLNEPTIVSKNSRAKCTDFCEVYDECCNYENCMGAAGGCMGGCESGECTPSNESCSEGCLPYNESGGSGGGGGCVHEWVEYHHVLPQCKTPDGHEWVKKCSKCKAEHNMGVYKLGVTRWTYDTYDKEKCKQWGNCDYCGTRYYKYPYHQIVGGRCVNCGYVAQKFEWDTPKVVGRDITVTASEWNRLQDFINLKRDSMSHIDRWDFTRVRSNTRMKAEEYNDVRQAISGMGGQNLPPRLNSGDKMIAEHLNMLRDSINEL